MTLYEIDRKAFDPYWNESHHEALTAMIEAGYIREVEPDYEAGAKEIGRLVYVQLADIGYRAASRRIVKAVLGIGGDDE